MIAKRNRRRKREKEEGREKEIKREIEGEKGTQKTILERKVLKYF